MIMNLLSNVDCDFSMLSWRLRGLAKMKELYDNGDDEIVVIFNQGCVKLKLLADGNYRVVAIGMDQNWDLYVLNLIRSVFPSEVVWKRLDESLTVDDLYLVDFMKSIYNWLVLREYGDDRDVIPFKFETRMENLEKTKIINRLIIANPKLTKNKEIFKDRLKSYFGDGNFLLIKFCTVKVPNHGEISFDWRLLALDVTLYGECEMNNKVLSDKLIDFCRKYGYGLETIDGDTKVIEDMKLQADFIARR